VRALVAELDDGEAGERAARRRRALAAFARHHRERVAVADRAQHARRVVLPAEPRLDEIARHHRHGLGVARLGEADGDGAGRHSKHSAMIERKLDKSNRCFF
jgi:hypothetical protein